MELAGAPGLSELLEPESNWRSGWISSLPLPDPTNENLSNGKRKMEAKEATQMERKWKIFGNGKWAIQANVEDETSGKWRGRYSKKNEN